VNMLADLAVGEGGRVMRVEGADDVSLRLMEMGLTPGVEVAVVGAAPWGGPLELEVRGYHLSLRRSEAARVAMAPL
jgi:ferrous iron transport protein A